MKLRQIASALLFALILGGFALACVFHTPAEVSLTERRTLKQLPVPSAKSVFSTEFMRAFEDYTLDQFPLREEFRAYKAFFLYRGLLQKDNNGVYLQDGHASKLEYRLNETSVQNAAQKINRVRALLPNANAYYAIIPDKNYYLTAQNGYPTLNYEKLARLMEAGITDSAPISLFDCLSIQDYYATDLHWRQERLGAVVQQIATQMEFAHLLPKEPYELHTLYPFYGVYYGQSALPLAPESMCYLTSATLNSLHVSILNETTLALEPTTLYALDDFYGIDAYDLYLHGATPLVVIENPDATTDRELVLFRDSYGSSLAPLLAGAYRKITLVDLRYLSSKLLAQFVQETPNQDVLFLYSIGVLNNSEMLKVD